MNIDWIVYQNDNNLIEVTWSAASRDDCRLVNQIRSFKVHLKANYCWQQVVAYGRQSIDMAAGPTEGSQQHRLNQSGTQDFDWVGDEKIRVASESISISISISPLYFPGP